MKNFKFIYALLAATLFVTACSDEELINEGRVPAADGSEIIFGGRAGFENSDPKGRTIYTGDVYTYDSKNFERIDWITGDKIEIYSPEASNGPSAHYSITNIDVDENIKTGNYGFLERQGESSLQWNGDGNHTFYAMYPSSTMFNKVNEDGSVITVEQGIKLDKSGDDIVVKGIVPSNQTSEVKEYPEGSGNYVISPNMNYAYMVAKTTANRIDNPNVGLSFVPIVTAVEIEMIVPKNTEEDVHDVLIAEIQVTGKGIAGDFTADLTSWTGGYPTCANVGDGQGTIQISTWKDNKPLTLKEGNSVKFTVFMRPGADYSNLTVSYSPTGSGYIRKNLFGTDSNNNAYNVNIPRNLKTRIKNLHLPATYDKETQIVVDASRWMDQLADEVEFKALSIPGTGGTFSYNYDEDYPSWYQQQTLNFEEQWKVGIRAFEIISDRPSTFLQSASTLGNEYVRCNGASMGVRVGVVLNDLITKVSVTNSEGKYTETAVLILTYQPRGEWSTPGRNVSDYAESLNLMMKNLTSEQKNHIIEYTPSITLGEARGNVMIFCRLTQRDEDASTAFGTAIAKLTDDCAKKVVMIDGCGTGKDRWGARGYDVMGNDDWNMAYDAAHTSDANKSVDYWMNSSREYASNVKRGELRFGFSTNVTNVLCWYQDWARVVDLDHLKVAEGTNYYERNNVRWYESYSEKVSAVEESFEMAVSGEYGDYIFINSLCGYLVDASIPDSYEQFSGSNNGGVAGNIKALADKINVSFYQYVLNSGFEQKTGPTGIIMMDYVKNASSSDIDGGFFLPGVIISNNFKGNLQTKPDGGTSGGGNTGGGSGSGSDEGQEGQG